MKKFVTLFLLSVCMMLTLTACGSTEATTSSPPQSQNGVAEKSAPEAEEQKADGNSKILVVYFSCTGNTKTLAENTADVLKADLYEIVPEKKYTSEDLNYNDESTRATVEQKDNSTRPAINGKISSFEKYDTIVIAYPIWWGQAPRIIDTFLESYDFSDKKIIPLCTSASSDIGSSADALHNLCSASADWVDGKRFSKDTSKQELEQWFSSHHIQSGK
ncbi:flavodoxin [Pectinatus haikarae]|uniref:flavodoxin n=1 Tax=Pectinatus haikarae TaxID=349096 RepID=UPI0018C62D82|nr:flavodoxin [Pectinatus haikarae]